MAEWRPVLGFEGLYLVSDDGRVWNVRIDRAMTIQADKDGYACLLLSRHGKSIGRRVSRLMLESFVGPAPEGALACHNDGDLTRNRLDNLRWDTPSGNMKDRALHGTVPVGENASRSKLTEAQVQAIRAAPRGTATALARSIGVTKGAASSIRSGRIWGHIPGAPGTRPCRGVDHPHAKLTPEIAAAIRSDSRFQKVIAADYGIHQVTVSKIKRGVLWAEAA